MRIDKKKKKEKQWRYRKRRIKSKKKPITRDHSVAWNTDQYTRNLFVQLFYNSLHNYVLLVYIFEKGKEQKCLFKEIFQVRKKCNIIQKNLISFALTNKYNRTEKETIDHVYVIGASQISRAIPENNNLSSLYTKNLKRGLHLIKP